MIKADLITDRIKTYYKNNRWQSRIIIVFLALIIVLGLIRLLLPPTIIYSADTWLKKQGIDSTIEAINMDIIGGTVSLINARGFADGAPLYNIGQVDIYWDWAPLQDKTIVVTKLGLDQLSVNIEQYTDNIIIGGVHIPLGQSTADSFDEASIADDKTDEKVEPWAASLGEVIFTDLNICYLQHAANLVQANKDSLFVDYCVELDELSWTGAISYATDKELLKADDLPLSSTGDFKLNGLNVTDNKLSKKLLVSKSNTLSNVIISGLNNLHIDKLDMNDLSLLDRDDEKHTDSLRFRTLTIDDINLSNLNDLTIDNINVSEPGVYLVKLNQTDWEYQQWIPDLPVTSEPNEKAKDEKKTTDDSFFKLALNSLNVNDSDLCYLDNDTSLYYCLIFNDLDWQGSVKYDTRSSAPGEVNLQAKGDLKFIGPNIHNHNIDRDLIDFDSLTLSNLDASGIDTVSLERLHIDKLSALQRGKDKDDNTASFENLTIDDIKYSKNKIEVSSIDLKGLANTVSKNKNGKWEHDKWQPKEKNTGPKNESNIKQQTSSDEPMIIALKKATVTSDKKIMFTDNSTSPPMKAGLQNIVLNLEDLNSAKPDLDSRFKLYAKTTRHSTIDIEGTAKPFAEKVSIDANGKLKGFDLRAASPATQKAIGHIIKSGQMDADLKLLAVDGVLDSNIGLSLYHFNIKATSKEDAAKLDKKFGMPLNQTLVLLRDKDDSIHLDIPITGDVNNPSFEPMDAIIKATSKAATVTLITFYTPYGLIYAGGNVAFNMATALNFDPINFAPGSPELLADGKEQLAGLSKLLTEKPQVHLTLCGVTNQQDAFTMYPELKKAHDSNNKDENKKGTEIKLSEKQLLQLEKLARDRQVNSKNYLIDKSGIAHDRLILCAPEHRQDGDAIAGVEINI